MYERWAVRDPTRFDSNPTSRHTMTASAKIIPNVPLFNCSPLGTYNTTKSVCPT